MTDLSKDSGQQTLYEIQALINAQDIKHSSLNFNDIGPENLQKQQKELNRRKIRLGKHLANRLSIGNNQMDERMDESDQEDSPNRQFSEQYMLKTHTMFKRINKFKSNKIVIGNQPKSKLSESHFPKPRYSQQDFPSDLVSSKDQSLLDIFNQGRQASQMGKILSQNTSFALKQPALTPLDQYNTYYYRDNKPPKTNQRKSELGNDFIPARGSVDNRQRKVSVLSAQIPTAFLPQSISASSRNLNANQSNKSITLSQPSGQNSTKNNDQLRFSQAHSVIQQRKQVWNKLFEARCEDLGLKPNKKQLDRFLKVVQKQREGRLVLYEMGLGQKSCDVLSQCLRVEGRHLTHLDLTMNRIGLNFKAFVNAIKQNCRIISIRLSNNEINGTLEAENIKGLVKNHTSLSSINFGNNESNQNKNKLGNIGFNAIMEGIMESQNSLISMIDVSGNTINNITPLIDVMKHNTCQFISINLNDNEIGTQIFDNISNSNHLANLLELQLSNSKLNNKSIIELSLSLKEHKYQMQIMNLSKNQISSEGLHKLMSSLKTNQFLKRLNMSSNDFHISSPFTSVEQFLSINRHLEELNLSNCKIETKGATFIARGLRKNLGLKKINLGFNQIGDEGMNEIIDAIIYARDISQIIEMDFQRNNLEIKDTQTICQLLKQNKKIQVLNIRDNLIRDESAEQILLSLKENHTITKLMIDLNPIKYLILKEVDAINKRNQLDQKEREAPKIQEEISLLRQERMKVLEKCNKSILNKTISPIRNELSPNQSRQVIETTEQLQRQIKQFHRAKTITQDQFMQDDMMLEDIKVQEEMKFKQLKKERKMLREKRRDLDFADEQLDHRIEKRNKDLQKLIHDVLHKVDIMKLTQDKTKKELEKCRKECKKKEEQHQLQKDAWISELEQAERQQNFAQLIYENYQKEIERQKKRLEEEKLKEQLDAMDNKENLQPCLSGQKNGLSGKNYKRSKSRFGKKTAIDTVNIEGRKGSMMRMKRSNELSPINNIKQQSTKNKKVMKCKENGGGKDNWNFKTSIADN